MRLLNLKKIVFKKLKLKEFKNIAKYFYNHINANFLRVNTPNQSVEKMPRRFCHACRDLLTQKRVI